MNRIEAIARPRQSVTVEQLVPKTWPGLRTASRHHVPRAAPAPEPPEVSKPGEIGQGKPGIPGVAPEGTRGHRHRESARRERPACDFQYGGEVWQDVSNIIKVEVITPETDEAIKNVIAWEIARTKLRAQDEKDKWFQARGRYSTRKMEDWLEAVYAANEYIKACAPQSVSR
jgi:hypothetical protein